MSTWWEDTWMHATSSRQCTFEFDRCCSKRGVRVLGRHWVMLGLVCLTARGPHADAGTVAELFHSCQPGPVGKKYSSV